MPNACLWNSSEDRSSPLTLAVLSAGNKLKGDLRFELFAEAARVLALEVVYNDGPNQVKFIH